MVVVVQHPVLEVVDQVTVQAVAVVDLQVEDYYLRRGSSSYLSYLNTLPLRK